MRVWTVDANVSHEDCHELIAVCTEEYIAVAVAAQWMHASGAAWLSAKASGGYAGESGQRRLSISSHAVTDCMPPSQVIEDGS